MGYSDLKLNGINKTFIKNSNFTSNLTEVYDNLCAQKLQISEYLIEFFFAWTLANLATSRGPNFNLSDLNRVSNFS